MSAAVKSSEPHPEVLAGLEPGPFHTRIAKLNRQHGWMNWMGFASPTVLENEEAEYFAIRNQSTLFDISPMCKYAIEGQDAEKIVNRLVTRDIRKLKPGRVAYVIWCDEDGNVIDDGTVFRLAEDRFRLCCQDPQLAWLYDVAWGLDATIRDETREIAALALQGPTSAALLRSLGVMEVDELKPFAVGSITIGAEHVTMSRTGFTGDLGYELWMPPKSAGAVWDCLVEAGKPYGLRVIGNAALEMARVEAGFLLPKIDFLSAHTAHRPNRPKNPFELGLENMIAFDKPHFNGRRALMRLAGQQPRRKLFAIEIDRNKPAVNALVYHRQRKEVGMVTSALWSPTCKRNIGFAWLDAPFGQTVQDDLWVEIYLQREIEWQRRMVRCRIVDRPFFVNERRRLTPPGNR